MRNLSDILTGRAEEAKKRFIGSIMQQKFELDNARHTVVNVLLGLDDCKSNYGLRERFTYVSKVQETLTCMLTMYKDLYGEEYQDPQPELVAP